MTTRQFIQKFEAVKALGFVKSKRRGPTGIGHTIEKLLGINENNISLPDLGKIELKAHRIGTSSLITLFTFNRKAWKMNPLSATRKYGTPDRNGRLGLYYTMSRVPNSSGLFLHTESESISVRHISGDIIAQWRYEDLSKQFPRKMPALILVSAFAEMRGDEEWFKFSRAQLLYGTSPKIIGTQIEAGNVVVDLRLHDKGTSARNHGTGFRTYEENLSLLFSKIEEL